MDRIDRQKLQLQASHTLRKTLLVALLYGTAIVNSGDWAAANSTVVSQKIAQKTNIDRKTYLATLQSQLELAIERKQRLEYLAKEGAVSDSAVVGAISQIENIQREINDAINDAICEDLVSPKIFALVKRLHRERSRASSPVIPPKLAQVLYDNGAISYIDYINNIERQDVNVLQITLNQLVQQNPKAWENMSRKECSQWR